MITVAVKDLVLNPDFQPRAGINQEHVHAIANSMKAVGFKPDEAISSLKLKSGKLSVVKGHHRVLGAIEAGIEKIPSFLVSYDSVGDRNLDALASNLGLPMKPMETLVVVEKCLEGGFSMEYVAKRIGKSEASLKTDLALLELPKKVQAVVNSGELSKAVAHHILKAVRKDGIDAEKAATKAIANGGNADKQKAVVDRYQEQVVITREGKAEADDTPRGVKAAKRQFKALTRAVGKFEESPVGIIATPEIEELITGMQAIVTTIKKDLDKQ